MGVSYESLTYYKICTFCGCYHNSDDDLCIVCLDELYGSDPGEVDA